MGGSEILPEPISPGPKKKSTGARGWPNPFHRQTWRHGPRSGSRGAAGNPPARAANGICPHSNRQL